MQITEVMVEQWVDNPATVKLEQMLTERLNWLTESRGAIYYPGEPQRTQEAICSINAQIGEVTIFLSLIDRDQFLSEVEDLELLQRSTAVRLPDSH